MLLAKHVILRKADAIRIELEAEGITLRTALTGTEWHRETRYE